MPYINELRLMGHLARDPEARYISSGSPVCDCAIAVNQGRAENKQVMFIDFTIWGSDGERFAKLYRKGDTIEVFGSLRQDKWEDHDGNRRSKHKMNVESWSDFHLKQERRAEVEELMAQADEEDHREDDNDHDLPPPDDLNVPF